MSRKRKHESQLWLPGTFRCEWQEGRGKRWYPAVGLRELGDTFMEVDVTGMGRRVGTIDLSRAYPGYIRPRRKRKHS